METEIIRLFTGKDLLSHADLPVGSAQLNICIQSRQLSAREMWDKCDRFTNSTLHILDEQQISDQNHRRRSNHPVSSRSKAQGSTTASAHSPKLRMGDLVHLSCDLDNQNTQPRYIVQTDRLNVHNLMVRQFRPFIHCVNPSESHPPTRSSGIIRLGLQ